MKTSLVFTLTAMASAAVLLAAARHAHALGSAFTYQGHLEQNGTAVNADCDMEFSLWNDAVAGSPGNRLGAPLSRRVTVRNGLFAVQLNTGGEFGPTAFNGDNRWLEIAVNCSSSGGVTPVAPRQLVTASPYATFSASAPWTGIAGKPAGFADGVDNDVLGGLSCASGQVPKSTGAAWSCAADNDTTTWAGVTGKPSGFADGIDNDVLGALSCASGQVAKWTGTAWACAADAFPQAGPGLVLSGGQLSVAPDVQRRSASPSCSDGASFIRAIAADGTPTCAEPLSLQYGENTGDQFHPQADGRLVRFPFVAPAAGLVLISAQYTMSINRGGVDCYMDTQVSATPSNTFSLWDAGVSRFNVPGNLNTQFNGGAYFTTTGATSQMFTIDGPGTYTFYLNGRQTNCADYIWRNIHMSAVFSEHGRDSGRLVP